jgi:carboxyl-terminal processing protease
MGFAFSAKGEFFTSCEPQKTYVSGLSNQRCVQQRTPRFLFRRGGCCRSCRRCCNVQPLQRRLVSRLEEKRPTEEKSDAHGPNPLKSGSPLSFGTFLKSRFQEFRRFLAEPVRISVPKPLLIIVGVVGSIFVIAFVSYAPDWKTESKIREKVALFDFILTDIVHGYVDPVDTDQLFEAGVDGMLGSLDPYTQFEGNIAAREMQLKTSGRYGGVGLGIAQSILQPEETVVLNAFEGYAFDRGVRAGDVIVEVDGTPVRGMPLDKVTELLRGEPGTLVRVRLARETRAPDGSRRLFDVVLPRRLVTIHDVPLYGMIRSYDGVGYIRLQSFATNAGRELRAAIDNMVRTGRLKALVLDLRNNPGGLLDAAVETAEALVPKDSAIVSTKGRALGETVFMSDREPSLPADVRLVVLTNEQTASAAEIVAGAVQDLDRGVIVGTRTFGKGLVQNVEPLPYNTALKYTVGKYYTPSGRCIQSVNYKEGSALTAALPEAESGRPFLDPSGTLVPALPPANGAARYLSTKVPESERKTFRTLHGRIVRDGGGIEPDMESTVTKPSELELQLLEGGKFFFFANRYAAGISSLPEDFEVDDKLYKEFQRYVLEDASKWREHTRFEPGLKLFTSTFAEAGYKNAEKELEHLRETIVTELKQDFERHADAIRQRLEDAIRQRFEPESRRLSAALRYDKVLQDALRLLTEKQGEAYERLLQPAAETAQT